MYADIAEFIFNTTLTDAQFKQVQHYLAEKWTLLLMLIAIMMVQWILMILQLMEVMSNYAQSDITYGDFYLGREYDNDFC